MNKTAIKNFAIWARNKLIAETEYKASLLGITEKGIADALPQSGNGVEYYDVGTKTPYAVTGNALAQRRSLVNKINEKAGEDKFAPAFRFVMEEVAYTWFNRLIAVRFMEVNDYLPSRTRPLSGADGRQEPQLVTNPFDAVLDYTEAERKQIAALKNENRLDEAFNLLFLKQCNALNASLPLLFEKTSDYTELLLNLTFTDKDGVVYHLVNDMPEDDWRDAVQIIGWLYQYYNTEPKDKVFADLKKNIKINKDTIPAATQLFTPDWIVRYMVENSLGRLWLEGHPNAELQASWQYYLPEAEQTPEVQTKLQVIRTGYAELQPQDIKVIDPCMGSGHILVYAFDVLMQIYESTGYTPRDAAASIVRNNLYGLDIDDRAAQLAYFSVMMKARQYNRRALNGEFVPYVFAIQESNGLVLTAPKRLGDEAAIAEKLLHGLQDAKEYGSILNLDLTMEELARLRERLETMDEMAGNGNLYTMMETGTIIEVLAPLIDIAETMVQKYDVVVTNPPYMGSSGMSGKLGDFVKKYYPDSKADLFAVFIERCGAMTKPNGYQAMITQHAWMFLSSFEKLRAKLLLRDTVNMAHLGARAFEEIGGEVVQTTSFVLRDSHIVGCRGVYCRLAEPTTQQGKEKMFLRGENRFEAAQDNFRLIPGMPVAFWVSDRVLQVYQNGVQLGKLAAPRKGNSTSDNSRFLRLWYEVEKRKMNISNTRIEVEDSKVRRWYPYNKGGGFRKWYGYNDYLVDWYDDAYEIRQIKTAVIANYQYFMKPGLTWSTLSSKTFGVRWFEEGYIFDNGGCCIFELGEKRNYIGALLNSVVFTSMFGELNPTLNFQSGEVAKFPVIYACNSAIDDRARACVQLSKAEYNSFETSWDFETHPLVRPVSTLEQAFSAWSDECEGRFRQLKSNEEELNRIFIEIYGLQDELTPDVADKDVTVRRADLPRDIRSLISYAVGCMFGRYSLDVPGLAFAGGEWDAGKYKTFLPDEDNCIPITDEAYFEDDIVGRFEQFIKTVYGAESLEQNLDFIANALGNKGGSSREVIRNYFLGDFFKDHLKIYQKRPIYWLYDSGKQNGFKALVYLHRYNADTTGLVRVDYLHKTERVYEREITRMQETIDNPAAASREIALAIKRKEKLVKQLKECKDYDANLSHLALARIAIDLDDGVKVNYEKIQTDKDGKKYPILAKI